ncbi:cobyric acid synthase [Marinivivus vitaminiproducens]|uniref:cobyric acid synthase n=1 Tax=Marinivivus vitaminiproducens TaxID=3035935 RepID=UPI00279830DE|nr:cobyric acid synthase [Geminicoccaceae bacterium SCSIO 64248]
MRRPPALMLQGTGSNAGKSTLTAGLCRALTRRGLRVRPFKPQNMSNNAAVTVEGGEIGRAQALQARACGVPSSMHMNPVLLKPQTDTGAQVVVQGRVHATCRAIDYAALKPSLMPAVLDSFRRVGADADLVLVEGAGSPAEVNLRDGDIANMGFALATETPVLLVGDIDRGGVLAQLVGTHALLPPEERRLLTGYVVNKFRGDPSLFTGALPIIGRHTGLDCLGIVPWCDAVSRLPAEDSLDLETRPIRRTNGVIRIAVPRLGRGANLDDLDPLMAEPDVDLRIVPPGEALPGDADLVILTGSKATLGDLAFLRTQGWDIDIAAHVRRGGHVIGLCGGYQMLGRSVADPLGVEGSSGTAAGLDLLPVETVLAPDKTLTETSGTEMVSGLPVRGYEIHMGRTTLLCAVEPMLDLDGRLDGARSPSGRVTGCYLHGLFAADGFRHAFLSRIRARETSGLAFEASVNQALDALADHLESSLDVPRLLAIAHGYARGGSSDAA